DRLRIAVAHEARIGLELGPRGAADEAMDRQPGKLSGDVPERDVDAGECEERRAVIAEEMEFLPQLVKDRADLAGVAADQHWLHHLVERHLVALDDGVTERLAPAADAFVGVDAQHQYVERRPWLPREVPRLATIVIGNLEKEAFDRGDLHTTP